MNELPARFQIGDEVRADGFRGTVRAITFDERGVYYDVLTKNGTMPRVDSWRVNSPLKAVA